MYGTQFRVSSNRRKDMIAAYSVALVPLALGIATASGVLPIAGLIILVLTRYVEFE